VPSCVILHVHEAKSLTGVVSGDAPHIALTASGGSFPEVKRPSREAEHSPPSSADIKNMWKYTSTLQYVFMTSTPAHDNLTVTHISSTWRSFPPISGSDFYPDVFFPSACR